MRFFLIRRVLFAFIAVIGATLIVFALSRAIGDPRYLYLAQGRFNQQQWDALGEELNLDKPLIVQYFIWLGATSTGDWGKSVYNGRPVTELIGERIYNTLQLGFAAFIFAAISSNSVSLVRHCSSCAFGFDGMLPLALCPGISMVSRRAA